MYEKVMVPESRLGLLRLERSQGGMTEVYKY